MVSKQNPVGHDMRWAAYLKNSFLSSWFAVSQSGMRNQRNAVPEMPHLVDKRLIRYRGQLCQVQRIDQARSVW